MMSLRGHQFRQPSVYVTEADYERLANLAETSDTRGAQLLAEELERAIVIGEADFPRAFVRLNSRVEFTDLMTGRTRRVEIVPPDRADIDQDRLSVLTPVGAALIGLAEGETIGMSTEDGRPHVLVVVNVERQHEIA
jgi:regulator of nucleoside diphosphate kinase